MTHSNRSLLRPLLPAVLVAAALAASACQASAPLAVTAASSVAAAELAAPAAGTGVQLTAGPFAVPPGAEVQNNFYMKLPVDHDVMVDKIEIVYPKGSHHCNVFKSDTKDVPDHVDNTFDAMYPAWDMFANSQTGDLHWQLPKGVGLKLHANQQLLIQSHYVNTLTQQTPESAALKIKINLHFAEPGSTPQTLGMFFAVNPSLKLLPHSTFVAQKDISLADQGLTQDVNLLAINGHFHSRGKAFQVNRWNGGSPDNLGELLYKSSDWQEPPFKIFENPLPLKAHDRLLYSGTFVNQTDITIGFGAGQVDTKEHSNMFLYYYPGPADGKCVYDVKASAFQEVGEI